jgi:hypothetical protein
MRGNKGFVLIAGCVSVYDWLRCSTCHWQRLVNDVCTMTAIRWIFPYRHTSLGMFDTFQKRVFFRFYQSQFQKVCLTFNLNFFFSFSFFSQMYLFICQSSENVVVVVQATLNLDVLTNHLLLYTGIIF